MPIVSGLNALQKKILNGGVAALGIKVGAAAFQFLLFLALANAMSGEDYGLLGFGFSLATLIAVIGSFGMRMLSLKNIQIYKSDDQPEKAKGLLRDGTKMVLGGTFGFGILACAFLMIFRGDLTAGYLTTVMFLSISIALAEYFAFVLRGYEKVMLALAPRDIIWRILVVLVCLPAIFGVMPMLNATSALLIMSALLVVIVFIQIQRFGPTRLGEIFGGFAALDRQSWRKSALGLWGVSVIQVAAPNLTVVVLGLLLAPSETGPVFAALRIALLLNLVLLAANMASSPFIARLFHEGKTEALQKICSTIALLASATAAVCFFVLVFFGGWILNLFGENFDQAYPALLIVAGAYFVNTLTGPSSVLLEVTGHERAAFVRLTLVNAISIVAMPVAVWLFAGTGVAVCLAFSIVGWNVSAVMFARRTIGVDPSLLGLRFGKSKS